MDNSGPVFGRLMWVGDQECMTAEGMSLRAYIATAALPAVIAMQVELAKMGGHADENTAASQAAAYSVIYADALIAELSKERT